MKCEKRIEKNLWGKTCDVKYISSFTEVDFKNKFDELTMNGYEVIWKSLDGLIMQYKWCQSDIVILTCRIPIKKEWYMSNKRFIVDEKIS